MRITRLLRYIWLLELDPTQREIVLQMLAEAEIQAARRVLKELLREKPGDEKLRLALAELEELGAALDQPTA